MPWIKQQAPPLISVIVPVHNAEKYLCRCIDSILAQTFTNFEVLLIDDGSSDRSGSICDEYAASDQRIRTFHKENGGVSSARNLGLDSAIGEWIVFVDADDYWIEDTALALLYDIAKRHNLDIARGEYVSVDAEENVIHTQDYASKQAFGDKLLERNVFLDNVVCGEFFLVLCLIKHKAIGGLRFDERQIFLEDMKFYMQLLMHSPRCGFLPVTFYAYRKHTSSASITVNAKKIVDSFEMCDFFWSLSDNCIDLEMVSYCRGYAIKMYYWTLQTLSEDPYYKQFDDISSQIHLERLHRETKVRRSLMVIHFGWKIDFILRLSPKSAVRAFRIYSKLRKRLNR